MDKQEYSTAVAAQLQTGPGTWLVSCSVSNPFALPLSLMESQL